jgi:addiction module HigA family antidote
MNKRKPNHPGLILKHHYMEPLNLTVTHVARVLDVSRKTLSKIMNGHAAITPELALKLSKAFSTSAELWLNLQQAFTLWEAAHHSLDWKKTVILHSLQLRSVY